MLIEEGLTDRLERGLRFAGWMLDRVDPVRRLSDVVVPTTLSRASYRGWRTRAEHQRNPSGSVQVVIGLLIP